MASTGFISLALSEQPHSFISWASTSTLLSGAGTGDIDCGEQPAIRSFYQMQFHIAGTLEFFKNNLVHPASGID